MSNKFIECAGIAFKASHVSIVGPVGLEQESGKFCFKIFLGEPKPEAEQAYCLFRGSDNKEEVETLRDFFIFKLSEENYDKSILSWNR